MVEHSGADNVVEAGPQFACLFDGKTLDLQIVELVLSFEFLGAAHACCAEVDAGHLGCRPAHRVFGRLRSSAAGDENRLVLPEGSRGPKQMMLRALLLRVLPGLILLEAIDRRGIWIVFVKRAHVLSDTRRAPASNVECFHQPCVTRKEPMHGLNHAWADYTKKLRECPYASAGSTLVT